MRKIILLAGLVAGGVALSATAFANNWLLYLPAILAGSGGSTEPPVTTESNKWLLFLPAILSGSQGQTDPESTMNDTGITAMVGSTGKEDADYGRDVTNNDSSDGHAGFSFTKIDSNGDSLNASAESWSCVQDNVTGLIWSLDRGEYVLSQLQTIVNTANSGTLCGGSTWRLSTAKELTGIVDYHKTSEALIESTFFTDIIADWYWTSTDYTEPGSDKKWGVNFSTGQAGTLSTSALDTNRVLLVR